MCSSPRNHSKLDDFLKFILFSFPDQFLLVYGSGSKLDGRAR